MHAPLNLLVKRPRTGFVYAVKACLRLLPYSLLWGGVPCSLLIWISSATSGRKADTLPMGDESKDCVRNSNLLLSRFSLLAVLATARHSWFCVEQPMSSMLVKLPYYDFIMNIAALKPQFVRLSGPRH